MPTPAPTTLGDRTMPHAAPLFWTLALPGSGGLALLAMNAEGWSAAIGALGFGVAIFIVRVAPAVAEAVRTIGAARAEVAARFRREMEAKVEANASKIESLSSDASDAKAVAYRIQEKADAAGPEMARLRKHVNVLLDTVARLEAELVAVRATDSDRRHAMAARFNAALDHAREEILVLREKLGITDTTHADAINAVAGSVRAIAEHLDPPLPVVTPRLNAHPPAPSPPPEPAP